MDGDELDAAVLDLGPSNEIKGPVTTVGAGYDMPRWYKMLFYVEKGLVVSCYNRFTCGQLFLFQGSSFSEAVNSVYRRFVLYRTMDTAMVPHEIRRALNRARVQQFEEEKGVIHQVVLGLVAARLIRRKSDAINFCMDIYSFASSKLYELVYLCACNWRIATHDVSE